MSDSPNRSVKKDLATDLSRKMQEMQNNQQNNDNNNSSNNNQQNGNNNNFNRPANRNPGEQTFVFHSDVNDTEERVSYDFTLDPRHSLDEIKYQIIQVQKDPAIQSSSSISNSIDFDSFSSENNNSNSNSSNQNQNSNPNNKQTLIIAHRNQFPKLISLEIFLKNSRSYINFGDLLEFAADNKKSHWVVYLGPLGPDKIDHCLHYSKFERKISIKPLASVAKDRPIRRVNGVYHYETKSTENIKMAVTKIKQAIENSNNNTDKTVINKIYNSFNSSEAFAAWVRYQVDDFLVNKENASISYKLQVTLGDGQIDDFEFSSLSKAIDKVRLLQKEGLRSVTESKNKMKDLLLF